MYKYIALDLDGTIVQSNGVINKLLLDLLIELQERGIIVILCSGRNIISMKEYINQTKVREYNTYIISSNGGNTVYVKDNELICQGYITFNKKEVKAIKKIVKNKTRSLVAYSGTQMYFHKIYYHQYKRACKYGSRPKWGIFKPSGKIILTDKKEKIDEIFLDIKKEILKINPQINVFRSVNTLIEITPPLATKGEALDKLFKYQGYDERDLIAFGDGENDLEMLKYAGLGVAMNNAFESVKVVADDITLSNDENGVYVYLKNLIYQKKL